MNDFANRLIGLVVIVGMLLVLVWLAFVMFQAFGDAIGHPVVPAETGSIEGMTIYHDDQRAATCWLYRSSYGVAMSCIADQFLALGGGIGEPLVGVAP